MAGIIVPSSLADIGAASPTDPAGRLLEKLHRFPGQAPTGVAGLIGDWAAFDLTDAGTAPGAAISSWAGSVGGVLVQATGINQPIYNPTGMGGHAGVIFDPTSHPQYLTNATFGLPDQGAYTAYAVMEPLNHGGKALDIFGFGGTINKAFWSLDTAKPFYFGAGSTYAPGVGWRGPGPVVCSFAVDRSGNAVRFGTDAIEVSASGATLETAAALTGLCLGCRYPTGNTSFGARMILGRFLLFSGVHSASTVAAISTWLAARYGIRGFPSPRKRRFIYDGSSILSGGHASTTAKSAIGQLMANWPFQDEFRIVGYGGATTAGLNGSFATRVGPYLSNHADNIVVLWEVANDVINGQLATNAFTYANTAGAAGAKVILTTGLYRQGATDSAVDTYNAALRSGWTGNVNVVQLADPNLDYAIGQPIATGASATAVVTGQTTYFSDTLHLTDAGQGRVWRYLYDAQMWYLRPPDVWLGLRGMPQTFFNSAAFTTVPMRTCPVAANTGYLVKLRGSARRMDSGAEFAQFDYGWWIKSVAGVVTVTPIGTNTPVYSAAGMTAADVTCVANGQAFDLRATTESGKAVFFECAAQLVEAA